MSSSPRCACWHSLLPGVALQARAAMQGKSGAEASGSADGSWKWQVRKRMWDLMEEQNIARWVKIKSVGGGGGV